jgi:hypothetical protein
MYSNADAEDNGMLSAGGSFRLSDIRDDLSTVGGGLVKLDEYRRIPAPRRMLMNAVVRKLYLGLGGQPNVGGRHRTSTVDVIWMLALH